VRFWQRRYLRRCAGINIEYLGWQTLWHQKQHQQRVGGFAVDAEQVNVLPRRLCRQHIACAIKGMA